MTRHMTKTLALELEPLTARVGAIANGVDLARPVAQETVQAIRQAVLDHGVIFFRAQDLSRRQMADFMLNFGTPCNDPFSLGEPIAPAEETILDMPTLAYSRATAVWHYDSTIAPEPASLMALRAVELPPVGGDTCWANMYAAYEALSAPLRRMLDGLRAEHTAFKVIPLMGYTGDGLRRDLRTVHPVIRVHPETGRKALFVNELWTERLVDVDPTESARLLGMLFEHVKSPEFSMRWRWRVNDVALWDNRAFQHYAVRDYQAKRVMQKSLVAGDRPFGPN